MTITVVAITGSHDELAMEMNAEWSCRALNFGVLVQFRTLFGKFFIMYWRSPSYNATRFVMTVR